MNLEETRNSVKKLYENKLTSIFSDMLTGKETSPRYTISQIESTLIDYLELGGIIEKDSPIEFSKKILEQSNKNIEEINSFRNFLPGSFGGGSIKYNNLITRNSNLSLEELRTIICNRFEPFMKSGKDIETKLKYMSDFVQCGGIVNEENITYLDEINSNPEYLKTYSEIMNISKNNKKARERFDLRKKEEELSSLEKEAKTYDEELKSLETTRNIGE